MIKPVIGIISYYSGNERRNEARNRTFHRISELFPETPVLIIAQNWPQEMDIPFKGGCDIRHYPKLGILKARQTLIEEFLKTDFDYLIMVDDDVEIYGDRSNAEFFLQALKEHPEGYCFKESHLPGKIIGGSLRLCAVSRFILENVSLPSINPEKGEGYEDVVWPNAIILKYPERRFRYPKFGVWTYLDYVSEGGISTWWTNSVTYCGSNWDNTLLAIDSLKEKGKPEGR